MCPNIFAVKKVETTFEYELEFEVVIDDDGDPYDDGVDRDESLSTLR